MSTKRDDAQRRIQRPAAGLTIRGLTDVSSAEEVNI
jgi:hypothetical protein